VANTPDQQDGRERELQTERGTDGTRSREGVDISSPGLVATASSFGKFCPILAPDQGPSRNDPSTNFADEVLARLRHFP